MRRFSVRVGMSLVGGYVVYPVLLRGFVFPSSFFGSEVSWIRVRDPGLFWTLCDGREVAVRGWEWTVHWDTGMDQPPGQCFLAGRWGDFPWMALESERRVLRISELSASFEGRGLVAGFWLVLKCALMDGWEMNDMRC